MKKFLLAFWLLPSVALAQSFYTVSNVPGTSANFKTLQGAHDSVAAGSVLYLLPSAFSYGNAVFTKKLTVYGTGYFLGANLAPNTQANTGPVVVQSITFRPGSDNSFVEGLQLTDQTYSPQTPRIELDTVSNVIVSRCLFTPPNSNENYADFFYAPGANNITIQQSYFQIPQSSIAFFKMVGITNSNGFSGFQLNNNIIDAQAVGSNATNMLQGFQTSVNINVTFTNNTFLVSQAKSSFGNLNYIANIFVDTDGGLTGLGQNLDLNGINQFNISELANFFPTPGNNSLGANTDSMFVATLSGYTSIDSKWQVRPGNFANTFAQGGSACGAYGGASPYKLSGIPNLPYIYSLTVPTQATTPGTIAVHIKAQASN